MMTFDLKDPMGRLGHREFYKLEDNTDISAKDRFKKYMDIMKCAEEKEDEDIMVATYLFLQYQAQEMQS